MRVKGCDFATPILNARPAHSPRGPVPRQVIVDLGRYKLGLTGERERHCPVHPGLRQVHPNRRHVLPRRLRLRRRTRPLYITRARRAKSLSNSDAPTPLPEAASQPRAQDSIAPANWIATPADSKPSAARTLLPARSRGICTKTPATWPVRTPQLRNTWRPVAGERKSRCCSHISSESFVWSVCV